MSAAVSHGLNQPLAAMKTYLAGARLLLQRKRPDEALSSFQRVDDLIERMGAITRQLKSYARKGGEAFEEVDLRACVSSALAMMEPQLRARVVKISRGMPRQPVDHRAPAERVADQPDGAVAVEMRAVEADDARRLLAAMLQGVQAERRVRGCVAVPVDREDAAFVLRLVVVERRAVWLIGQVAQPHGLAVRRLSTACRCWSV